jgi:hypothetical protein
MSNTSIKHVYMKDLHFELKVWLNELKFFKEELGFFDKRLMDVAQKNTEKEMLRELEHFQNQFIRQNEVIDETRHDVKQAENTLEQFAHEHPIASDHVYFSDHVNLRENMNTFRDIYTDLKKEYLRFLAKWL